MSDALGIAKVGSLVAAALETTGAGLQSEMLDFVTGTSGQTLAGMLFLLGIATAVITLAAGGNYRWGRYLMVGPPLFFFLTQVRIASNGTEWQFADQAFPKNLTEKMLKGVSDFDNGQLKGKDVAMFFQFWNVFMSELTQKLIGLLDLTDDGSHLNFVNKIERYMSFWIFDGIIDKNMRLLISSSLVPNCGDYFQLKMLLATPSVSDPVKEYYKPFVEAKAADWAFTMTDIQEADQNELYAWLSKHRKFQANRAYTCDELWAAIVKVLKAQVKATMDKELELHLTPGQKIDKVKLAFFKKILTETSRASSQTKLYSNAADLVKDPKAYEQGILRAVNWIVARSLWNQVWDRNKFADYFDFEGHPMNRSTGAGEGRLNSDSVAETSSAIEQFNRTEVYQFKGDFVNAALSMPHFQGVMLLLLSASYPFFAMMVVIPGRSGAILTWMGLWAWVKLWDFGFAVVMMIDNILYAIFPRAPNLTDGEMSDPGKAWMTIMEVDPNYSAATYYNIIAACLFAVPLVTAMLVKGGASELTGLVHGSWQQYSNRLSGSAATFARSLQAQSYARRMEHEKFNVGEKAGNDRKLKPDYVDWQRENKELAAIKGLSGSELKDKLTGFAGKFGKLSGVELKNFSKGLANMSNAQLQAAVSERQAMLERMSESHVIAATERAAYDYSVGSAGQFAANSAVRSRFYSHMFAHGHPGRAEANAEFSKQFYNKDKVLNAGGNSMAASAWSALKAAFGGTK